MRASHQAWVDDWTAVTDPILPNHSLTSPRAWLESMPSGAYTVLRYDQTSGVDSTTTSKIWGRDFHMKRLENSIRPLMDENEPFPEHTIISTQEAVQQTNQIIHALLSCYEVQHHVLCDSYMVTILWFLRDTAQICVRGHITPYQTAWDPKEYNPQLLKVIMAYDPKSELPSRKDIHPEAKLSWWCHARRPLETKFKVPYQADEVFLLDDNNHAITKGGNNTSSIPAHVGILEGLTSNVFVVHQDGTLYTAPDHSVLKGYARQLVMESALRLGMNVNSSQPIFLGEVPSWTEVFVTSAIKLVTPVQSVAFPTGDNGTHSSKLVWSQTVSETKPRVWEAIYKDILAHNLYS